VKPNDEDMGWPAPVSTAVPTKAATDITGEPVKDTFFKDPAVVETSSLSMTGSPMQKLLLFVIIIGAIGGFMHLRRRNKPKPGRFPV